MQLFGMETVQQMEKAEMFRFVGLFLCLLAEIWHFQVALLITNQKMEVEVIKLI